MGFFSGSFGKGLVEGIATGATRTLQTVLDQRQEEMSAARKYMMQRQIDQSEKLSSDAEEMEGLIRGFAELTGGDLDKAAQLIKGAGSIDLAKSRLALLNEEAIKNKDFDINKTFTFAESQVGKDPYAIGDYIESLITRPKDIVLPGQTKFGLGMADKILGKAPEGIKMPESFGRKIDIGAAKMVPGQLSVAKEYERQIEAEEISLQQARATLSKTLTELSQSGAVEEDDIRRSFSTLTSEALTAAAIPNEVDAFGNVTFDLKDIQEKRDAASSAYKVSMQSITEEVIRTNSLEMPNMRNVLKTAGIQALNYVTPETPTSDTEMDNLVVGNLYNTKVGTILYLGGDVKDKNNYIVLRKPE